MPRLAPHLLPSKEKKVSNRKNFLSEASLSEINSSSSFRLSKEIRAKVDTWRTKPKPRVKNEMLKEVNHILTMGEIDRNLSSSKKYLRTVQKALNKSIEKEKESISDDEKHSEDESSRSNVRNLMSFWNDKLTYRPITVSYDYSLKNPSKNYKPLSKDGVQEEHTLKPSQIKEVRSNSLLKKSTSHNALNKKQESIEEMRKKIMERVNNSKIEIQSNKNKWMTKYLKNINQFKGNFDSRRLFWVEIFKLKYLGSMKYPYVYYISTKFENVEVFEEIQKRDSEYKMSVETISYITGIGPDFLLRLLEIMDRNERTPENLCSISHSDLDKLSRIKNELPFEKSNVLDYVESVEDLFLTMGDTCKKRFLDLMLNYVLEFMTKLKRELFHRKKTYIFTTSALLTIFVAFIFINVK